MNNTVKVLIVEPSVIIRRGMLSVLQQLNTIHMEVFEITEPEQLRCSLCWRKPDIVIINPAVAGFLPLSDMKKEVDNPELKCIALQNSLSEPSALKFFDEVFYVYDSVEQLAEKLNTLMTQHVFVVTLQSITLMVKEDIVRVFKGMKYK